MKLITRQNLFEASLVLNILRIQLRKMTWAEGGFGGKAKLVSFALLGLSLLLAGLSVLPYLKKHPLFVLAGGALTALTLLSGVSELLTLPVLSLFYVVCSAGLERDGILRAAGIGWLGSFLVQILIRGAGWTYNMKRAVLNGTGMGLGLDETHYLALCLMILVMLACYFLWDAHPKTVSVSLVYAAVLCWCVTCCRTASVCLVLLPLLMQFRSRLPKAVCFLPAVLIALSVFCALVYPKLGFTADAELTPRLESGARLLKENGIRLFGSAVEYIPRGSDEGGSVMENAWILLFVRYGLFTGLLTAALYTFALRRFLLCGETKLAVMTVLLLFCSLFSSAMLSSVHSFVLLCLFTKTPPEKKGAFSAFERRLCPEWGNE